MKYANKVIAIAAAVGLLFLVAPGPLGAAPLTAQDADARLELVQCANLIYAGSKTSHCFSDKFLRELNEVSSPRA